MRGSFFHQEPSPFDVRPCFYAYYYKQWQNYTMEYHEHRWTEIMYMIQGTGAIDVLSIDGRNERIVLRKGEFIILDEGVPHRLTVDQAAPCRMLNVEFGFQPHAGQFSLGHISHEEQEVAAFLTRPFRYLVLSDPEEVYYVLKSLVLELDRQQAERSSLMIDLLFSQLLVRMARLRIAAEDSESVADGYVTQSIQFMHQNYDQPLQVKDIAAYVNLHPGYLHRIFKKNMNQTLMEYLTEVRMEKAKMLLQQTGIPIHDIPGYVGINSRQYFHTLFKKHTGVTPVNHRELGEKKSWDWPDN
ncbi:AraC family transcriptional regulator [Neobacillus mesonae]|nr:AraC family transcriptional regulator [Neobacillus mesonae]